MGEKRKISHFTAAFRFDGDIFKNISPSPNNNQSEETPNFLIIGKIQ